MISLIHFRLLSVELIPCGCSCRVQMENVTVKKSACLLLYCAMKNSSTLKCFAFFQLQKKARLNKYVRVIGLPKKDPKSPANVNCLVVGWGSQQVNKPSSPVLKEATEKLQFQHECKNVWQQHFNSQHMLCTKFTKDRGGICQVKMIGMKH